MLGLLVKLPTGVTELRLVLLESTRYTYCAWLPSKSTTLLALVLERPALRSFHPPSPEKEEGQ